ncbi:MAG: SLC13 family permease, partial [Thermofilaceae archaeon]
LIISVMIVVEIVDRYGTFRYIALKVTRRSAEKPGLLLVSVGLMSALTSLLLSDEAAILLFTALMGALAKLSGLDLLPFAIASAVMVNLGGTGMLTGSLPNMVVGLRAGFNFLEFALYILPLEFILYGVTLLFLYSYYSPKLRTQVSVESLMDVHVSIVDAIKGAVVLASMISSLVVASLLDLPVSGAALLVGTAALAVSGFDTSEVLRRVEWDTVFFAAAFTALVGVVERADAMRGFVEFTRELSGGSLVASTLFILFVSGTLGLFVPNVITALSFIPLVDGLPFPDKRALWVALVVGSNLSGVGLPVSSYVIVLTLGALRREGYKVDPWSISKIGIPLTGIWLLVSTIYLLLRFNLLAW